jgi:hypothetical protein
MTAQKMAASAMKSLYGYFGGNATRCLLEPYKNFCNKVKVFPLVANKVMGGV